MIPIVCRRAVEEYAGGTLHSGGGDDTARASTRTLWQSIDEPVDVDDKAQAHFVENYLQLFDNPNVELMARRQLNATLIAKYRDASRRRITRAKANPALDETWDAEVRALAPVDSDDLEDMLRDD